MDAKSPRTYRSTTAAPRAFERSGRGPTAIGAISAKVAEPRLGKRGFVQAALLADWPEIVGSVLASATHPLRIAFARGERSNGTLHLRVASGSMALQLQHLDPLIRERVNGHFGYAAVARLAIAQGPLPGGARKRVPRAKAEEKASLQAEQSLAGLTSPVADPALRVALQRLGRRLAQGWR